MSEDEFESLLTRMGAIADAVNAFKSDAVQQAAFSTLIEVALHKTKKHENATSEATNSLDPKAGRGSSTPKEPKQSREPKSGKKTSNSRGQWTFNKNLDLRPRGKKAFAEFVDEKKPSSNEERYAVIVYYLSEIAGQEQVSINDVGSAFRLMPTWREPTALDAGLRMASSRKGTLDTSDLDDVKLTPHGRNFVELDLPAEAKT